MISILRRQLRKTVASRPTSNVLSPHNRSNFLKCKKGRRAFPAPFFVAGIALLAGDDLRFRTVAATGDVAGQPALSAVPASPCRPRCPGAIGRGLHCAASTRRRSRHPARRNAPRLPRRTRLLLIQNRGAAMTPADHPIERMAFGLQYIIPGTERPRRPLVTSL